MVAGAVESGVVVPGPRRTFLLWGVVVLLLVILGAALFFCAWVFNQRLQNFYRDCIFPNVYILGEDLGGYSSEAAADVLAERVAAAPIGQVIMTDGERQWSVSWEEAGLALDIPTTLQLAMAEGRAAAPLVDQLRAWTEVREISPVFTVDLEQARQVLEALSGDVSIPPVDARIGLQGGEVVLLPGEMGRVLDVTDMLGQLQAQSAAPEGDVILNMVFRDVQPPEPDITDVQAQVETLLARQVQIAAYDVVTEQWLSWTLARADIAPWLRLTVAEDGASVVDVEADAVQATLQRLAETLVDGRGFRFEEATRQVLSVFDAGGGSLDLYLTHPERRYIVQAGDILGRIGAKFGMPPGLIAEANPGVDLDRLQVGQELIIPSQDVLTPYIAVQGKKIVISIAEQKMWVYENGGLIHEWIVSTGIDDSPTHRGLFQVVSKELEAYASQWDLLMPYFIAIYPAGGAVYNGIHELPILANGQRLWAGNLGHKASFGCIILGIPEAETLFSWTEIGVLVVIQ